MSEIQMGAGAVDGLRNRVARFLGRLVWIVRQFSPWGLFVPVAISYGTVTHYSHPLWRFTEDAYQSNLASQVLCIGLVISASFWALRGEVFHRWLILVTALLMLRKIQPEGLGNAIYAAPILLLWDAGRNFQKMRPYLMHRFSITLTGGAFLCFCAVTSCAFDWWSNLPHHEIWKFNLRNTLETAGYAMIVMTIIGTEFLWRMGRLDQNVATEEITVKFLQDLTVETKSSRRAA